MTIYFDKGEGMGTFLEIVLLIALVSIIGLVLGYLVGLLTCQKNNKSHILEKGKVCEARIKLNKEQSDLLEKESQELIEVSQKESLLTTTPEKNQETDSKKENKKEDESTNTLPSPQKDEDNLTELKSQLNALSAPKNNQADDLKEIKGIGVVIEKKLHQLGIFHFEQIATWDEKMIALVDEHLAFKGRIYRERWIEQAKEFVKKKQAQ